MARILSLVPVGLALALCSAQAGDETAADEVIELPVNGVTVRSRLTLKQNIPYTITVSGTFTVGGPGDRQGDAEYADFSDPLSPGQDICGGSWPTDFGVAVNGRSTASLKKFPAWGPYNPRHVYSIEYSGQGAPILLNYHDCFHGDNEGMLIVRIVEARI